MKTSELIGIVSFYVFIFSLAFGLAMMIVGIDYFRYGYALAVLMLPIMILAALNTTLPRSKS